MFVQLLVVHRNFSSSKVLALIFSNLQRRLFGLSNQWQCCCSDTLTPSPAPAICCSHFPPQALSNICPWCPRHPRVDCWPLFPNRLFQTTASYTCLYNYHSVPCSHPTSALYYQTPLRPCVTSTPGNIVQDAVNSFCGQARAAVSSV